MDEDALNISVRKFLKRVGVASQREIETAVRDAVREGRLEGDERLDARMTLRLDALGLETEIAGAIELE